MKNKNETMVVRKLSDARNGVTCATARWFAETAADWAFYVAIGGKVVPETQTGAQ